MYTPLVSTIMLFPFQDLMKFTRENNASQHVYKKLIVSLLQGFKQLKFVERGTVKIS